MTRPGSCIARCGSIELAMGAGRSIIGQGETSRCACAGLGGASMMACREHRSGVRSVCEKEIGGTDEAEESA